MNKHTIILGCFFLFINAPSAQAQQTPITDGGRIPAEIAGHIPPELYGAPDMKEFCSTVVDKANNPLVNLLYPSALTLAGGLVYNMIYDHCENRQEERVLYERDVQIGDGWARCKFVYRARTCKVRPVVDNPSEPGEVGGYLDRLCKMLKRILLSLIPGGGGDTRIAAEMKDGEDFCICTEKPEIIPVCDAIYPNPAPTPTRPIGTINE